jgi:hypothetical protein
MLLLLVTTALFASSLLPPNRDSNRKKKVLTNSKTSSFFFFSSQNVYSNVILFCFLKKQHGEKNLYIADAKSALMGCGSTFDFCVMKGSLLIQKPGSDPCPQRADPLLLRNDYAVV